MTKQLIYHCLLASFFYGFPSGLMADTAFEFPFIRLVNIVIDHDTGQQSTSGFENIQSPFQDSATSSLGNSFATSSHDVFWDDSFARFLVEGSHQLEDHHLASSTVSTLFTMRSTVDLETQFSFNYQYNLPANDLRAVFGVTITDLDQNLTIISFGDSDDSLLGSTSGVFFEQGETVLNADTLYRITMGMRLDTFGDGGPGPGQFGTGSGNGMIEFRAIPEPGTLSLFFLSMILMNIRRVAGYHCSMNSLNGKQNHLPE